MLRSWILINGDMPVGYHWGGIVKSTISKLLSSYNNLQFIFHQNMLQRPNLHILTLGYSHLKCPVKITSNHNLSSTSKTIWTRAKWFKFGWGWSDFISSLFLASGFTPFISLCYSLICTWSGIASPNSSRRKFWAPSHRNWKKDQNEPRQCIYGNEAALL